MNWLFITDNWTTWNYRAKRAFEILGHKVTEIYSEDRSIGEAPPKLTLDDIKLNDYDDILLLLGGTENAIKFLDTSTRNYICYLGDMMSIGNKETRRIEAENKLYGNRCRHIILSSEGWKPHIKKRGYNQNTTMLYPYVPPELYPKKPKKPRDGYVVIGSSGRMYRNYSEYCTWLSSLNLKCHSYCRYPVVGCQEHDMLPQKKLLKELTKYDVGIAGFTDCPELNEYTDAVTQMKIFDYWAAGLAVEVIGGKSTSRFVEDIIKGADRKDSIMTLDKLKGLLP